jgi:hypothetical protein
MENGVPVFSSIEESEADAAAVKATLDAAPGATPATISGPIEVARASRA